MGIEVERLEALFTANTAQAKAAFTSLDRQISELDRKLSAFSGVDNLSRKFNSGTTSTNVLAGAVGGLVALVGQELVSSLRQAGSAVVSYSSNLQQARIAFSTMLGSEEAALDHLKELQRFALSTPFEFEGLVAASRRLQALGFEANQVVPILTDVGNAVAAVGGSKDVLDRVVLALSQIQTKGKVSAQEMNQLAEAGIPAWRLLSEAIGKSRGETIKLAEDGKISSAVFLDAFRKFSQANFGGMMERQSRTFAGAMSNVKDTLLQTASTAFEPLFAKISEITDRAAQEMQQGKPGLEAALRSIVTGLVEILGTAGAEAGAAFIESTASKIGNKSEWERLLSNISGATLLDPFLRGLFSIDPEDLFGLGDPTGAITKAVKIPDLRAPLPKLTNEQTQNSEAAQKAADIYKDLALKVAFYGQNTETAATKQRLLAIGMEALTSAEGRQALQIAQLIDKQRLLNQMTEIQKRVTDDLANATETKYKSAFETLLQVSEDARLQIADLAKTEQGGLSPIERFNFTVGAQIEGLLQLARSSGMTEDQITNLAAALVNARSAMMNLTAAQENNKRRQDNKQLNEQKADLLRSIREFEVGLNRELRQIPTDPLQQLAGQLEHISFLKINPGGLDLFVEKLRTGTMSAQAALAEIGTAINNAASDLGPELFGKVSADLTNLLLKAQELGRFLEEQDATERYKQTLASLAEIIQGDIQLTNAQRIEKLLLTDAYKTLNDAQKESLRVTAAQADAAEELRRHQEEMTEIARDMGSIFGEVFDSIGDSWEDMWQSMIGIARRLASRLVEDIAFSGFFQLLNQGQKPTQQQAGSYGLSAVFGNLLNLFSKPAPPGGAGTSLSNAVNTLPKRAFGGPVIGGVSYLVGDHPSGRPNPEIFTPAQSGHITPLDRLLRESGNNEGRSRPQEGNTFILALGDKQMREALEEVGSSPSGKRARVMQFKKDRKAVHRT